VAPDARICQHAAAAQHSGRGPCPIAARPTAHLATLEAHHASADRRRIATDLPARGRGGREFGLNRDQLLDGFRPHDLIIASASDRFASTRGLRGRSTRAFNPCADDSRPPRIDHWPMTTTEYLINLLFVLIVARQAYERKIDRRYFVIPIVLVLWVATQYLHALPTAGNDLVLIAALASVGVALGTISGLATHIRREQTGVAYARVGWLAGILLVAGISSRMVFAFAISHGLESTVRSFSIAHHITGAAWTVAMVLMALSEVGARLATVYLRTNQLTGPQTSPAVALGSAA
jgi:hypothetical protein